MQKMRPEYAQRLLDGGYAFGNGHISCNDELLIVEDDRGYYYGHQLKDGCLQVDNEGYVVFSRAQPVIDETTRFQI